MTINALTPVAGLAGVTALFLSYIAPAAAQSYDMRSYVAAANPAGPAPVLTPIDEAERLGTLLYRKDRAARLATDDLVAHFPGHKSLAALVGWLSEIDGDRITVTFVGESAEGPVALFRSEIFDGAIVTMPLQATPLTARQGAMWQARNTALSQRLEPSCTTHYNAAVIDSVGARGEDVLQVYLIPAQPTRNDMPVGGFHRVTVTPDGRAVIGMHAFSEGCLMMKTRLPDGSAPVALALGHPTGDAPEEHHVFLSLAHATTLYVVTESGQWNIAGGRIRRVEQLR